MGFAAFNVFTDSVGHPEWLGAHVRAREGAARDVGPPQATEPGCGAAPHVRNARGAAPTEKAWGGAPCKGWP